MTAAIALGSNLPSPYGDREANLREALRRMETLGHLTAISTFHDTEPVDLTNQPRFLNAAALLETNLPPPVLMRALLEIERQMGRDRTTVPPKGPRVIDLDLLLYGNEALDTTELVLPHPAMHQRTFVLAPLAEIAPDMPHPKLHRTIAQLLSEY